MTMDVSLHVVSFGDAFVFAVGLGVLALIAGILLMAVVGRSRLGFGLAIAGAVLLSLAMIAAFVVPVISFFIS